MCNRHSLTKSQQAIREMGKAIRNLPAVFPDKLAWLKKPEQYCLVAAIQIPI